METTNKLVSDENFDLKMKVEYLKEYLKKQDAEIARLNQEIGRLSKNSSLRIAYTKLAMVKLQGFKNDIDNNLFKYGNIKQIGE